MPHSFNVMFVVRNLKITQITRVASYKENRKRKKKAIFHKQLFTVTVHDDWVTSCSRKRHSHWHRLLNAIGDTVHLRVLIAVHRITLGENNNNREKTSTHCQHALVQIATRHHLARIKPIHVVWPHYHKITNTIATHCYHLPSLFHAFTLSSKLTCSKNLILHLSLFLSVGLVSWL